MGCSRVHCFFSWGEGEGGRNVLLKGVDEGALLHWRGSKCSFLFGVCKWFKGHFWTSFPGWGSLMTSEAEPKHNVYGNEQLIQITHYESIS